MESMIQHNRLGDILIKQNVITGAQLNDFLQKQKATGKKLGKILTEQQIISDQDLLEYIGNQYGIATVELATFEFDQNLLDLLTPVFIRREQVFPLFQIGDELTVAMTDPKRLDVIDEIHQISGLRVNPMLCTEKDFEETITRVFKDNHEAFQNEIEDALKEYQLDVEMIDLRENHDSTEALEEAARETPIIRLSSLIITAAFKEGASDIHIEPEERKVLVRYRVDGIMKESFSFDKGIQAALISRFKIMSGLDIAEKRLPQDGRFQTRMGKKNVDFRISTFPTINGENVVMRILDKSSVQIKLPTLGFDPNTLRKFEALIHRPHGIILVTGPTGSGKTTTLYSALNEINSIDKNIITVEDPIEYRLELVRQCQIIAKIGLTFATGLRSILRQDPDVIMVGEIRDRETAHIAIESALTGHLVFSTLHTNDAASAINRLTDMGIEPFLTASALSGVLAQRLVRKLCPKCKIQFRPEHEQIADFNIKKDPDILFYRPQGCPYCNNQGYKGRMAIYELLVADEEIKKLTNQRASSAEIKESAIRQGMRTLRQDGYYKVMQGLTSIEEIIRVTSSD